MPVGFLAVDDGWRVTVVNAEALRISGTREDRMVGRLIWDLHPALPGSAIESTLRDAARTGLTQTTEAFVPEPFDRWLEVRATPGVDGLAVYFLDVTERRQSQERLEQRASHDRSVATTLQSVLLSDPPSVDDAAIVGRYLTAAQADRVGGDWYDAIVQSDQSLTLVIGDVVGHDIVAAAAMGQLRAMLRMSAWNSRRSPSDLVAELDRAVHGMSLRTMATMVLGRLEACCAPDGARTFRWSNAGHPPPVVLDADGSTRVLDDRPNDVFLGVAPDMTRDDHETLIAAGSTLFFYTDGLVEVRGASLDDGIGRLRAALERHHELDTDDLVDAVLSELGRERPDDDTAVLAVRLAPPG